MADSTLDLITRVKYVGQDFRTYQDEAENFLKENYPDDYNDYVNNNLGVALLQSIAYANQNLAFYLNQRVTNLFLLTSTSQVAISRLARMLNYDIQPAIPFVVDVTVELNEGPYDFAININKGFRFNAVNGLTYEYRGDNPIVFQPGETVKTFQIEEGETRRNTFTSSGEPNQRFKLTGIDDGYSISLFSAEVIVGTQTWNEQRRITFDALPIYELNYFADPPEVRFGDGVAGLVPEANRQIQIDFRITQGIQGAIAANQIISANDQLVVKTNNIPITILSSSEASDGDDAEDLRSVKVKAPEFFQSQDRAITKRDYDGIVNTFPGVAKADAQIIRNINQDLVLNEYLDDLTDTVSGCVSGVYTDVVDLVDGLRDYLGDIISDTCKSNTVQVSVLAKNGNNDYVSPTQTLLDNIKDHLNVRKEVTHVLSVIDGTSTLVPVDLEIEVKVNPEAKEDIVLENVRLSLLKNDIVPYGLLVLREYGENLYLSDLYRTVREGQDLQTDIEYVNIKITSPLNKLDSDGNLIIDETKQEIIVPGTLNIIKIVTDLGV